MKLLLALFMTMFLSPSLFAAGGVGDDPNLAKSSTAEAGSTFTSAVSRGDQPAFCEKCEQRTSARLSNNVGVLTTTSGASSGSGTIGTPVKTGQ
jgi:hypothetical protein